MIIHVLAFTEIAIAHENDVASHQAVKKSDGLYHSDGEKVSPVYKLPNRLGLFLS